MSKIKKSEIIERLVKLRDEIASRTGMESYKVLQYRTIENIVASMPSTLEELKEIKGIGPKKLAQFGKLILITIHGDRIEEEKDAEPAEAGQDKGVYTVSEFLDQVNDLLADHLEDCRIQGEITGMSEHPSGVYFALKDKDDESILNCYLPPSVYHSLGLPLEDGLEVKVSGLANIWKPKGKFSLRVETIELVGAGSLKKAYEMLKQKLEQEGLFRRKRELPEFITSVGVITSRTGAVIQDFIENLAPLGIMVNLFDARVEGRYAVNEVRAGVRWFNERMPELDVLVIMRGGGSLEDLQAFNNELVGRDIFASRIPTIAAIGHDRDIPVVSLVADQAVSTPTAAAVLINNSWSRLLEELPLRSQELVYNFTKELQGQLQKQENMTSKLTHYLLAMIMKIQELANRFKAGMAKLETGIINVKKQLKEQSVSLNKIFIQALTDFNKRLVTQEKYLASVNPENNLKLGYSIVRNRAGQIVRSTKDIGVGEIVLTKLYRGEFDGEVKKIIK